MAEDAYGCCSSSTDDATIMGVITVVVLVESKCVGVVVADGSVTVCARQGRPRGSEDRVV